MDSKGFPGSGSCNNLIIYNQLTSESSAYVFHGNRNRETERILKEDVRALDDDQLKWYNIP